MVHVDFPLLLPARHPNGNCTRLRMQAWERVQIGSFPITCSPTARTKAAACLRIHWQSCRRGAVTL